MGEIETLRSVVREFDELIVRLNQAEWRVIEHKREVERRDELLAGADADLKAEREGRSEAGR